MENQTLEKYLKIPSFQKDPITEADLEHIRQGIADEMKLSPTVINSFYDIYCPVREEHSTKPCEIDATEAVFRWSDKIFTSVRAEPESDKLEEDILVDLIASGLHVDYLNYLNALNDGENEAIVLFDLRRR